MRATSQLFHALSVSATSNAPRTYLIAMSQPHIKSRIKLNTLLGLALLAPLSAQAALPAAIQTALTRAGLTPTDISILITPVGEKDASRLPTPIQVIDSSPVPAANTTLTIKESRVITVSKQDIQQKERQLQAYTDDAYTYQSVESTPSILSTSGGMSGNSADSNNTSTPIKPVLNPLLSHQPEIARTPASTMKLIPSFVALDTLGADFVWLTRVYHTGMMIGNRLYGDLIIQGSGDPKMTHKRLQQLLYKVQKTGIRHIDGDIIIDSAIFNNVSKNPADFDNAPLRPYNASPDGFLVNFSSMGIQSYPLGNGQAQLIYTPQLANYQLPSLINTRPAACARAKRSLTPQWQADKLTLNAKLPDSCGKHLFYVAYPNAKDFAARVVAAKWQQLGNTLSGKVLTQETPYNSAKTNQTKSGLASLPLSPLPIVSYPSLPLVQQIYDINHFSNNVMAEQVALSLGAYGKGKDNSNNQSSGVSTAQSTNNSTSQPMSNYVNNSATNLATSLYQFDRPKPTDYPAALQSINQWWQTNLTTPPPHLTNGSGLCRDCTVTAANLSELLTYAYNHPSFGAYVDSLGVAGVTGTIAAHSERLPDSAAIGRAWIKTGTLKNVTAMAGYVKGRSGQDYTVVGLIDTNQALNPYTARPVLDAMLNWTAQH
ncbi:D-alanyl-D-alanine carboxypeptidase/D-alanyl-D-alanine-endopeptidase [Psychrobacter sp. 72-O-c]|uniref:D-alanyl-D-alanine carboxypeptidase/D-alanyl-D-alanine-endopeptidase n=1 Tax=Psychrobacter sp. 72-O-c TaxID=2774125 RepID=UPI001D0F957A|nr:D-alanyl-D-alanine carboxypeptidase [Psychrobacter sp. 72-O-c]